MKKYQAYLIDLDGTLYNGEARIETAERFVQKLLDQKIPFLFVTNNATRTPEMVAQHIEEKCHLKVEASHVYTSSMALVDHLKTHHPGDKVHLVGEPPLQSLLKRAGIAIDQSDQAPILVQALDRHTDYDKLSRAANVLRKGGHFYVTNFDRSIPTKDGAIPSSGALTAFLAHTANVEPVIFGKPNRPILDGALAQLGLSKDQVLMIGDNLETDIQGGIDYGIDTLMVLTGLSTREQAENLEQGPTYIFNDLEEWLTYYESH